MTGNGQSEFQICAFSEGFVDLDEYECSKNFGIKIAEFSSLNSSKIILDLRKCWLDYSSSPEFLIPAINLLLKAGVGDNKTLVIQTTVDLGSPSFLVALLFRVFPDIFDSGNESPEVVKEKLSEFSRVHNLRIEFQIFQFDKTEATDTPESCFHLPE
jgi:hypothetical protein